MKLFIRAVVTGFALSLGTALFKRVAKELGLDDDADKSKDKDGRADRTTAKQDGGTDPELQLS